MTRPLPPTRVEEIFEILETAAIGLPLGARCNHSMPKTTKLAKGNCQLPKGHTGGHNRKAETKLDKWDAIDLLEVLTTLHRQRDDWRQRAGRVNDLWVLASKDLAALQKALDERVEEMQAVKRVAENWRIIADNDPDSKHDPDYIARSIETAIYSTISMKSASLDVPF